MTFQKSDKIRAAIVRLIEVDDDWSEIADASCTTGCDNDGSTGFEIFSNGFNLALVAAKKGLDTLFAPVFVVKFEGVAYFFIGGEETILTEIENRINAA